LASRTPQGSPRWSGEASDLQVVGPGSGSSRKGVHPCRAERAGQYLKVGAYMQWPQWSPPGRAESELTVGDSETKGTWQLQWSPPWSGRASDHLHDLVDLQFLAAVESALAGAERAAVSCQNRGGVELTVVESAWVSGASATEAPVRGIKTRAAV
jgi:hypothetical protein